jgi:hypothetical protein
MTQAFGFSIPTSRTHAADVFFQEMEGEFMFLAGREESQRMQFVTFLQQVESKDKYANDVLKSVLQYLLYSMDEDDEMEIRDTMTEKWKINSTKANPNTNRFQKKYPELYDECLYCVWEKFFEDNGRSFLERTASWSIRFEGIDYEDEQEPEEVAPLYVEQVEDSPPEYQLSSDEEIDNICDELDEIIGMFKNM